MKRVLGASAFVALSALTLVPAGAATVYSNNFSTNANGFVGGSLETSPSSETYLANFQRSTTTLTVTGLSPNSAVSLGFTLDAINSLDGGPAASIPGGGTGDYFNVSLNGTSIFSNTFANFGNGETQTYPSPGSAPGTGAAGIDTLGWSPCCNGQQIDDAIYDLSLNGTANALGIAQFAFNDDSNEAYSNEHYGIDNVVVTGTYAATTPLPAALPLFVSGLGALGFMGFRRKRKQRKA